jgi:hypothetical protein
MRRIGAPVDRLIGDRLRWSGESLHVITSALRTYACHRASLGRKDPIERGRSNPIGLRLASGGGALLGVLSAEDEVQIDRGSAVLLADHEQTDALGGADR